MTIRLDPAARRKVERLAAREGLSLNEALGQLLRRAPDELEERRAKQRRYRLKPRKVGFGFEIASARRLAGEMSEEQALGKLKRRR